MIIGISGKAQSGKDTTAHVTLELLCRQKGITTDIAPKAIRTSALSDIVGWQVKKFFDKPKQMAAILIGCTVEQLEDGSFKDKPLGEEWWYYQQLKKSPNWYYEQLKKSPNNVFAEEPKVVYAPLTEHEKEFMGSKIGAPLHKLTPRRILQLLGDKLKEIHPMAVVNSLMSEYKITNTHWTNDDFPNWIVPDVRFIEEVSAIKKAGGIVIRVDRTVNLRYPVQWEEFEGAVRPKPKGVLGVERTQFIGDFYQFLKQFYPEVYKSVYHESEIALDNYKGWNGVLDNGGSLDSLRAQIEPILYKYKIPGYEYRQPK